MILSKQKFQGFASGGRAASRFRRDMRHSGLKSQQLKLFKSDKEMPDPEEYDEQIDELKGMVTEFSGQLIGGEVSDKQRMKNRSNCETLASLMVSCEALVNRCGLTQSRVCRQVFFKLEGEDGLLLVGQITDEFKVLFTNNASGHELKRQLFTVLKDDLQWKMTHQEPTLDYGSIKHEFAVIGGRNAVTLTQEMQVVKVAELVYGPKLEDLPDVCGLGRPDSF